MMYILELYYNNKCINNIQVNNKKNVLNLLEEIKKMYLEYKGTKIIIEEKTKKGYKTIKKIVI